jgi:lysine decarboxylase
VPLVADETWGPHLRFGAGASLPVDALTAGADAVITSTHTLLSSLSQGSILLVRGGRIDVDRVAAAVRLTQPTTPYLPLLASIDSCRAQLEDDGPALVGWAVDLANLARTLLARVPGLRVLEAEDLALGGQPGSYGGLDPCKLVVDVRGRGLDGIAADRTLREAHAIATEGSDPSRLYLTIGPGDSVASVRRLVLALAGLGSPGLAPRFGPPPGPPVPEQAMPPREAYGGDHERVQLGAAVGRVCAELVAPYPPGVPVLAPGEVVTAEVVRWLQTNVAAGVHLLGPDDPALQTLRVVRPEPTGAG